MGRLRGGCDNPFNATGVVLALVGGPTLELRERDVGVAESASVDCWLTSPADASLWSGDECTGELDLRLPPSPLPPRDELRGETLPTCHFVFVD